MHNKFSTAKYRCGHLALLPDNFFCKIKKFVESYGYEFVWFVGEDIIDYGGAVVVKRGR